MLCRKYAHLLPEYPYPPPPRVPPRTLPAGHSRVTVSRLTERALEGRNPRSPEWVHGGRRGEGVPGLAGVVQPIEGIVYRRMAPCPLPAPPPLHSLRSFRGYSLTVVAFTSTMDRATSEGRSTRGAGADRGVGVCLSVIPVPTWYHTD